MTDPFDDAREVVDPTLAPPPQFPIAQWVNGDKKMLRVNSLAGKGGVFIPAANLPDGLSLPGWGPFEMTFENGKTEAGLGVFRAEIAVIRTRFRWSQLFQTKRGLRHVYTSRYGYNAEASPKMKGNVHALCVVKGSNAPIVIAFTGRASQEFETLLQTVNDEVLPLVNTKRDKPQLARYGFWLPVVAAPQRVASEGYTATFTPPALDWSARLDGDEALPYLRSIFVGRETYAAHQALFKETESWQKEWDKYGTETPVESADAQPQAGQEDWDH